MKILVLIARVPDPVRKIWLTPDGRLDETAVSWVTDPLDEMALEQAVQWRETGAATEVVAVAVGSEANEEPLRAALARGADRAVLAVEDAPADARSIAYQLAELARREQPDLILTGSGTMDDGVGQAGARLAALLRLPFAAQAAQMEMRPGQVRVVCETEQGQETLDLTLPAVVTAGQWLAAPRLLSLFAIVQARAKSVERIIADGLGLRISPQVTCTRLETPAPRGPVRMVADVAELVTALREEARVI